MFPSNRVVWKEGLFLQPQHFQQSERSLQETIHACFKAGEPYYFGIKDISIDRDGPANGVFALTQCTGVLPDGTSFDIPTRHRGPAPRSFADHFTGDIDSLDVYLALSLCTEGQANVTDRRGEGAAGVRYVSKPVTMTDEVTGGARKEIEVGEYNLTILFGGESLDGYSVLKVAQLKRSGTGQVMLNESYIPPLLQVGGSAALLDMLRNLLDMLLGKIGTLSQGRRQLAGGFAEFTRSEETAFRLLNTLNTYTPLLNHYHITPSVHPFELFTILTQFAGSLCTFSTSVSIRNLTRYEHQNLTGTFGGLLGVIRSVLQADISSGAVVLPVEEVRPSTYMVRCPDKSLLAGTRLFLGVSADVPEKELIVGAVQRIKICSQEKLDVLISSAMPGVPLIHSPHPPENLPSKPGYSYFALDQKGPMWQEIHASGTIAIYFPSTYRELALEMVALRQ